MAGDATSGGKNWVGFLPAPSLALSSAELETGKQPQTAVQCKACSGLVTKLYGASQQFKAVLFDLCVCFVELQTNVGYIAATWKRLTALS